MAAKRNLSGITFKATMAQVSVPASSANVGPGFDCFGIALELRDRYAAQVLDDPTFDVDVTGEGADEVKKDAKNLVIKAMMHGFEHMGGKPKGIALRALNVIPHGRGLGSSASAIVAKAYTANLDLAAALARAHFSGLVGTFFSSICSTSSLCILSTCLETSPSLPCNFFSCFF